MAFKLINQGAHIYGAGLKKEYLCDTDADFENLPESTPGSAAVSIESGKVYVVNTQGEWVPFGG